MASKIAFLVAAIFGSANAVNDSEQKVNVDPATAQGMIAALKDVMSAEQPMMKEHSHKNSLLRTGQHLSKGPVIPLAVPDLNADHWTSDFEKDVSDLVLGLSASGAAATPGMGGAIEKIKHLINTEMIPKVVAAHAKNQDTLNGINSNITQCGTTRVSELATASAFNVTYRSKSTLHQSCRSDEASFYSQWKSCVVSRDGLDEQREALSATLQGEINRTTNVNTNEGVMEKKGTVEVYLTGLTSTICGAPLDCAKSDTYCDGSKNPPVLKDIGDSTVYNWHHGPAGTGYLDMYTKAKKAFNEKTTEYKEEKARCETLKGNWTEQKEKCNTIQDAMDHNSCKWAIGTKDACEKYEGCYTKETEIMGTEKNVVISEEKDRKAEWKGLKRMMCILDAFDGGINQTEIDACKAKDHDVSHLDINYPNPESQVECTTPTEYPATGEYKRKEFAVLPVLARGKIDMNLCTGLKSVSLKPNDVDPMCVCSRVTLDGFYTAGPLVKCVNCKDVHRSEDVNSCPSGTKLFAPRSESDWQTFITSVTAPLRDPNWIVDVTRPEDGCLEGKCDMVMNSNSATNAAAPETKRWVTTDGHPWWLRTSTLEASNDHGISGDYKANCYLNLEPAGADWPAKADAITFKEDKCTYHSKSYYCQPNDHGYKPKAGSPQTCSCRKIELTGPYSAEVIVKCEKCHDISKSLQTNSCPDGMKLFSPASADDWKVILDSVGTYGVAAPNWIVDVTRPSDGCGGCTTNAMNSETTAQATWDTTDKSAWFLKAAAYEYPNAEGDYKANCFLSLERSSNPHDITFKNDKCNPHSVSYLCQTKVTTTTTTTTLATCATFTADVGCTTNWKKKAGVDDSENPNNALCCEQTCAAHTCQLNWRKLANASDRVGNTDADCCEATCAAHTCSTHWVPNPKITPADTPGSTDEICCEALTCGNHNCSAGMSKKAGVDATLGNTDAVCCEFTLTEMTCSVTFLVANCKSGEAHNDKDKTVDLGNVAFRGSNTYEVKYSDPTGVSYDTAPRCPDNNQVADLKYKDGNDVTHTKSLIQNGETVPGDTGVTGAATHLTNFRFTTGCNFVLGVVP